MSPYSLVMNQGSVYQVPRAGIPNTDLSGSIVTSVKAGGVFVFNQCVFLTVFFFDYFFEQLLR